MKREPFYRRGMDHFPDSTLGGHHESSRGASMGALLALAIVLVLAAASAGVLVAGA
jgi:hypothetical protein